jgi:signal transduction histidine kinase
MDYFMRSIIVAYAGMIVFLKNKQLSSNLRVAAYTIHESMQAGDWALALGHLMTLEKNGPVFQIQLSGSLVEQNNLTGPFGEMPFGAGKLCKIISVGEKVNLSGCMVIFGIEEIITFLLFILLASGLFFIVFKMFSSKLLLFSDKISEELKRMRHLGVLAAQVMQPSNDEISEIVSIREYILLLLDEAREASQAIAISRLSMQVAHDIRSPLTALDMAIKDLSPISEEQRILIHHSIGRIYDIANNLLNNKRHSVNINEYLVENSPELISDLILSVVSEKRVQYKNKPVEFIVKIDEVSHSVFINVSASMFKRVISNLLNNSVEALEYKTRGVIRIEVMTQASNVIVTIHDNGYGISPDLLKKILMGAGGTQKKDGNGLGLPHAIKMIEDEWNGQFSIQSCPDEGTKIKIILKCTQAPLNNEEYVNDLIIIDDNQTLTDAWILHGEKVGKRVLAFNRIIDLKLALPFFNNTIPIYIDFDLNDELCGRELSKELYEMGFANLNLITGYPSAYLEKMPWIKNILGKEPPF